jgi:hypothetical protein
MTYSTGAVLPILAGIVVAVSIGAVIVMVCRNLFDMARIGGGGGGAGDAIVAWCAVRTRRGIGIGTEHRVRGGRERLLATALQQRAKDGEGSLTPLGVR